MLVLQKLHNMHKNSNGRIIFLFFAIFLMHVIFFKSQYVLFQLSILGLTIDTFPNPNYNIGEVSVANAFECQLYSGDNHFNDNNHRHNSQYVV